MTISLLQKTTNILLGPNKIDTNKRRGNRMNSAIIINPPNLIITRRKSVVPLLKAAIRGATNWKIELAFERIENNS